MTDAEPTTAPARAATRGRDVPALLRRWGPLGGVLVFILLVAVAVAVSGRPSAPGTGGTLVYEANFDDGRIGPDWKQSEPDLGWKAGTWQVVDGQLEARDIHNAALWLQTPMPERVRVEFEATALSDEGDVKAEIFGDGRTHQSGYIAIFGGWKNSINAIARLDEHGEDRKEDRRCSHRKGRTMCVEPDVPYRWTLERTDGELRWYLDGVLFLTYDDANPVQGRHFAFNNWEAPVRFDNLKIYDLGAP